MGGSLEGKWVVVTGGSRGLGKTTAALLARHGARVLATSRTAEPLAPSRLPGPGQTTAVALDVTQEPSVLRLFSALDAAGVTPDVLVNNAGVGLFKPLTETRMEEWEQVLRTNLTGAFLCAREAFRRMAKGAGGRIINVGSIAGQVPLADNAAYAASKFGLRGLSQVMSVEGAARNVRVSLIQLGATWTELWQGREGFDPAQMLKAEDLAQTVLEIAQRPLHVRVDEVTVLPPRGIL